MIELKTTVAEVIMHQSDFSYLSRLALSAFTEGNASFQTEIEGWIKS